MRRLCITVVLVAACGGGGSGPDAMGDDVAPPDADVVPVFRNPVALPDDQLALQALQILGANVTNHDTRCNGCHALTRQHIRYWRSLTDTAIADCYTDLGIASTASAQHTIDCFRLDPSNPGAAFTTPKVGVFASASRLPWFKYLFRKAYGGTTEYDAFVMRSGMPPGASSNMPMTQAQFDIVAEWFYRGVPLLDQTLPEDPPPTECFPSIGPEVAAHVTAMTTDGWRAHNMENGINMYACAGSTDPKQCLQAVPLASSTAYGATWDVAGEGHSRILMEHPLLYSSSYWTRSSADGRFIAHGGGQAGFNSTVMDLQRTALINIDVAYDPGFFPDNLGFVFQGGNRNVCAQSVLANALTNHVTMSETGCSQLNAVDLYQHVARTYNGDYFSINGEFVSDDGGHGVTSRDPQAFFGSNSVVALTPMVFTGTAFSAKPSIDITLPFEGDTVISPSSRLLISRLSGPNNKQLGFVMRQVNATPNGTSYDVTTPEIARYCFTGGKPAYSYDERWLVFHHYLSPTSNTDAQELGFADANDPGYANYKTRGAANVFVLEIATGAVHRITNMKPGQYALYPHFRSDGWIYFEVRDIAAPGGGDETEYTVASDATVQNE